MSPGKIDARDMPRMEDIVTSIGEHNGSTFVSATLAYARRLFARDDFGEVVTHPKSNGESTHVLGNELTELAAFDQFGSVHESVEVVRDRLVGDGLLNALNKEVGGFGPT